MDVPGSHGGGVEGIGTQDLTVGGDDQGVVMGEFVADIGDAGRLTQEEFVGSGEFGDGCWGRPAAPAPTGGWLGDHEPHLVGRRDQTPQDGGREEWGTSEGNVQGALSALLGEQVLSPLTHGRFARLPVRAVQYQDAVEVVDLVLQDPGQQVGGLYLQRLA